MRTHFTRLSVAAIVAVIVPLGSLVLIFLVGNALTPECLAQRPPGKAQPGAGKGTSRRDRGNAIVPPEIREKMKIYKDVVYGADDTQFQKLDAYLIGNSSQPSPVLVYIHGGGFGSGTKEMGPLYASWVMAGISYVTIDYRLTEEGKNAFPIQGHDVGLALQFIRSKAREWNIDPNKIATHGFSAGAHLSSWIALHDDLADPQSPDPRRRLSARPNAYIHNSGPTDFSRFDFASAQELLRDRLLPFFNCKLEDFNKTEESKRAIKMASPTAHASLDDPPGLIVLRQSKNPRTAIPDSNLVQLQVPAVINNPHDSWYAVALVQALAKAKAPYEVFREETGSRSGEEEAVISFLKRSMRLAEKESSGTDSKRSPSRANPQ